MKLVTFEVPTPLVVGKPTGSIHLKYKKNGVPA